MELGIQTQAVWLIITIILYCPKCVGVSRGCGAFPRTYTPLPPPPPTTLSLRPGSNPDLPTPRPQGWTPDIPATSVSKPEWRRQDCPRGRLNRLERGSMQSPFVFHSPSTTHDDRAGIVITLGWWSSRWALWPVGCSHGLWTASAHRQPSLRCFSPLTFAALLL